jgi:hypothetical protein
VVEAAGRLVKRRTVLDAEQCRLETKGVAAHDGEQESDFFNGLAVV